MKTQAYSDATSWISLLHYNIVSRDHLPETKVHTFNRIRAALEARLGPLAGRTLLEVGCGQWESNVRLFGALGAHVIGVDPELRPRHLLEYPAFAFRLGAKRAVKSLARDLFFRPRFERQLQALTGLAFHPEHETLLRTQGQRLPLEDASVDAVFSDNVFEHIEDVPAVTAEMARVLKPGGIAFIIIHPFAAFSGGHNLSTMTHQRASVPPWDHLRHNTHPAGCYLNKLRETDYLKAFEAHLSTLSMEHLGPEGAEFLTDDILRELPHYSKDELLTGKLVYTGRKR